MPQITNKLLKQAIADAEAVRETAVANAKLVLEEAITPQIREMIARRLSAGALYEGDDDEEVDVDLDVEDDEGDDDDGDDDHAAPARQPTTRQPTARRSPAPVKGEAAKQMPHEDGKPTRGKDFPANTSVIGKGDNKNPSADAFDDSGIGGGPEGAGTTPDDWYDDWNESDFDLKEIIAELEDEIRHLSEQDPLVDDEELDMGADDMGDDAMPDEEEVDLEEILRELDDADDMGGDEHEAHDDEEGLVEKVHNLMREVNRLKQEKMQFEYAVNELRSRLNEVNLLNAKLLYTNKMFRKEGLTNEQKVRIVESFDRAATVREVKLVYTAIVENLSVAAKTLSNRAAGRKVVAEGFASKATRTTAPAGKNVIVENTVAQRLKELAGII
jgi:hypothetical protein